MANETNCVLLLTDIRFSSVNYKLLSKPTEDKELIVNHNMQYKVKHNNVQVTVVTNIQCDDFMELELCTVGDFTINDRIVAESKDKESLKDFVIKNNTVAIMFPYIRAQVTLLTSQPGFNSVVLQPVDITKMTGNAEIIDETD